MEIDQLKKIIVRKLFGQTTGEENHLLEEWQNQSKDKQKLVEKLTSYEFLQRAAGDDNLSLRQQEWKKLERRTLNHREHKISLTWWKKIAAVTLPFLIGLGIWMWPKTQNNKTNETAHSIQTGFSKAIIELANGHQINLVADTIFQLETERIHFVNQKDTLNLIQSKTFSNQQKNSCKIRIPQGGEYIARLEDGSVVHLNAASELEIPANFGINSREVWLKGEAYFDVTHDKNRVFTVHTEKANISVLGTSFDIRAYEEEETVATLVEGSVEISSGKAKNQLKPGEQARLTNQGKILVEQVNVYPFIAWKTGRLVFENQPLEKIMKELQRWYDFEIIYATPEIKDLHFTFDLLKYNDISKVLAFMEKTEKVSFTQQGRSVILSPRKKRG